MDNRTCDFDGCHQKHRARGYCIGHYHQYRDGRDLSVIPPRRERVASSTTLEDAFWALVLKGETCWAWRGTQIQHGYGQIKHGGMTLLAHRYSWELANGPLPEGALIDHICHNESCVNPEHLRPVTHKQNMENRRGANRNSKSGVRGVYWDKNRSQWRVVVRHNGKNVNLGRFHLLEDAEKAAVAGRERYFTHSN